MRRWLLLGVLSLAACGDDGGAGGSLLAEPRLLAVRAIPASLVPGTAAELEALVIGPAGDALAAELSWRACDPWSVFTAPSSSCPPERALTLPTDARGRAVLDLDALLARFPPPRELLSQQRLGQVDCVAPVVGEVPIVVEARLPNRRLLAVKRIPTALDASAAPRTNPRIDGLLIDDPRSFELGAAIELGVSIAPDSFDVACDREVELVTAALYATAGRFDDDQLEVTSTGPDALSSELTVWEAPLAGGAVLWVIAVDDAGGTDWARYALTPR